MGWASGSEAANRLWKKLKPMIGEADRQRAAEAIVSTFEDLDADDWDYEGGVYKAARPDEVIDFD